MEQAASAWVFAHVATIYDAEQLVLCLQHHAMAPEAMSVARLHILYLISNLLHHACVVQRRR